MIAKNSCKDCTKRYLGCHDRCEVYQEYRKALDAKNKQRQDAIAENTPFIDLKRKAIKIARQKGRL